MESIFRDTRIAAGVLVLVFLFSCSPVSGPRSDGRRYLEPREVNALVRERGALVIDTMSDLECMDHRIPGSVCMPVEEFEKRSPVLLKDVKVPLVFYCESEGCPRAPAAYDRAGAAGFDEVYILRGGLAAWKKAGYDVETVRRVRREPVVSVKPGALNALERKKKGLFILDIRSEDAFRAGHIEGAVNIPLHRLQARLKEIPANRPVVVVDENGKRSFLASCYLINNGFSDVTRLYGGMEHEGPRKAKKG